jgi:hypothetical protein
VQSCFWRDCIFCLADLPERTNPPSFYHHREARKVNGMEIPQQSKIPILEFKKLLGSAALKLSDCEIEHLRDLEDRLADIIFDSWLRQRNSQPQLAELSET